MNLANQTVQNLKKIDQSRYR